MDKEPKPRGRIKKRTVTFNDNTNNNSNSNSRSRSRSRSISNKNHKNKNKNKKTKHNRHHHHHHHQNISNDELISTYKASSTTINERKKLLKESRREYISKVKLAHNNMSSILNSMNQEQEQRYEAWNRSFIPKNIVKNIMNNILNSNSNNSHNILNKKKSSNIDNKCVIIMQALSKCLVIELVSKSREIQKKQIDNYIKYKNKYNNNNQLNNQLNNNNNNNNNDIIDMPPLPIIFDNKDNNLDNNVDNKGIIDQNDNNNQNTNDLDNNTDDDIDIEPNINEEIVFGAIRPSHIREALRSLQSDPSSFFHQSV